MTKRINCSTIYVPTGVEEVVQQKDLGCRVQGLGVSYPKSFLNPQITAPFLNTSALNYR